MGFIDDVQKEILGEREQKKIKAANIILQAIKDKIRNELEVRPNTKSVSGYLSKDWDYDCLYFCDFEHGLVPEIYDEKVVKPIVLKELKALGFDLKNVSIVFRDCYRKSNVETRRTILGKPIYDRVYAGVSIYVSISW